MSTAVDTAAEAAARAPVGRLLLSGLLGSIGFGLFCMTLCLPSLPSWTSLFDASRAEVQLSFSAFVIAFGGAQVIYGPLSDRYGRRRLLLAGFALAALGAAAGALAASLEALVAARFLQGAGAAAGIVIGRAMVQDLYAGGDRTRVMAYVGMVMGLCPPVATIVGGQLHVHFGWQANFVLMAAAALLLFLVVWREVPRTAPVVDDSRHWLVDMLHAYARLARLGSFLAYVAILSFGTATFYIFLAGAPAVMAGYGVGPAEIGWFIAFVPLSYIAGSFVTVRLAHRLSELELMFRGQCLSALGIALVLALAVAGVHSPFAVAMPLALLGAGHGLLMPPTLAGTVSLVPALAGAAAAVAGLTQQLLGAFGGYAVGLMPHDTAAGMAALMLAFSLLSFAAQAAMFLARRRSAAAAGTAGDD
ncbi:MAG: Bcr/CflA family efflux MFS transporter [Gammaproteobacteria bacterium]